MDLVTDEDESDEESEEDFELSEKEQRFLQEAYDIHAKHRGCLDPIACHLDTELQNPRMPAMYRQCLMTSPNSPLIAGPL